MQSWLDVAPDSDFSIHNLPFGVFKTRDRAPRTGIAIGDYIVDLVVLAEHRLLSVPTEVPGDEGDLRLALNQPVLNDFIALGKPVTRAVRLRVQELLVTPLHASHEPDLWVHALVRQRDAEMCKPLRVPNYTDFYSSLYHATNVGAMFRDPKNALLPNWRHLPVAYHGRASSIVVSGTPIRRPCGQIKRDDPEPIFGPTHALDFELEVAFIVGKASPLGRPITTSEAEDHIFGLVLFNDWSARDIQKWEYQPLGPFLGKNFGSTVSPWIVTLEALEPFRVSTPLQAPEPLPYLRFVGNKSFDIHLEVDITTPTGATMTVCRSNFKHMYWNMSQQLAHHTVNGCNVEVGDLMASGTLSGPTPESYGSMLELTWNGRNPIRLPDGSMRTFIEDGDTITLRGWAERDGIRVGFGEARTTILSAWCIEA
ncbi:MAG: fumarylacetoacetase [Candidatus Roseilinea sp.]|nr:MAG: fumarylacetoacetase [Candidatus Roseilinea sp.]